MSGRFKDLRKAAFAVGFGVTIGKFAAEAVAELISGIGIAALSISAKNGNEIAQEVCKKAKIKVGLKENKEKESELKNNIIGFRCE